MYNLPPIPNWFSALVVGIFFVGLLSILGWIGYLIYWCYNHVTIGIV